ncbi:PTS sugar transporter subunit IIA [Clostridium sp. Marseille-P3244]|uniref:PTS sugar transporter subunit IIA n=1 Tax=Clostridium sp. Marseille-P3244 TaxID=1871020 RepID=UPI0009313741|nr:hypothetical protein [Clostridium sp. Marseille-P3244]
MSSTYIFILTHGRWGEELLKSTEMVTGGTIPDIRSFSLMPEMPLKTYQESIESAMESLPGYDFLFLADIPGGTPYNIAACYTQTHNVEAVCGLSMELLLAALDLREKLPCPQLPSHLISHFQDIGNYITDLKKLFS